ncbi:MAG: hypothetical protein MAG453_00392 [Calditrichaeota bacterium]|nr:hypothetical protein [Calditrichota bacterium]
MIGNSTYGRMSLCALAALVLAGCKGATGPPGDDAPFVDRVAPDIELVEPEPFAELTGPAMRLSARPRGDTPDLAQVLFYVNGSSRIGEDSAVVSGPPWEYLWDFELAGTPYGPLTVTAVARDTAGNRRQTPLRLVTRRALTGRDTLADLDVPGAHEFLTLPLQYVRMNEDSTLDTVSVDRLSTRFRPRAACRLLGAQVYLLHRPDQGYPLLADFHVIAYASADSVRPGEPLDSAFVQPGEFATERWLTVDLHALRGGEGLLFAAGESFFLGLRAEVAPDDFERGLVLRTTYEQAPTDSAALERAYWYEQPPQGSGWAPISESDVNGYVDHLHIRALIEYSEGG